MATQSKTTTNHDQIRRWAEARHAQPARVKGTGSRGRDPGMIRLDFPGYSGHGKLEPISWDQWFKSFDDNDLALVYQEKTAGGQRSNFNKLVGRETARARARARGNSHASRRKGTSGSGRSSRSSGRSTASGRKSTRSSRSGSRSGTSARRSSGSRATGSRSSRGRSASGRTSRSRSTGTRSRGSASRGSKRSSSRSRS